MKTIIIPILAILLISCDKDKQAVPGNAKPKDLNLSKTTVDIINTDNIFGLKMFQEALLRDSAAENIFISPTSIALALAMTYNGADGETRTAIENALQKQGLSNQEINESYQSLVSALKKVDSNVLLEIANSIWYRDGFTVLPDFLSINKNYYNAQVSALDFNNPEAVNTINGWVSNNTHQKITQIVDQIPEDAIMYLINAIYFKGIWKFKFDKQQTEDGPFYVHGENSVSVPFMKQTSTFRHLKGEKFSIVELPYGVGNFSMIVLVPHDGYTTEDITDGLTAQRWDLLMSSMGYSNVELHMPRFTFSYKNVLNDELSDLGMGIAFSPMADFSGINGLHNLMISKVTHKAFVAVDEEGTEAAAVTSVEVVLTSLPGDNLIVFNVNKPFVFAIRETTTGAILFIGRVKNPLTEKNGE